ncbi:hypothetical protein JAAARDRAFT_33351 [Jaapia argillacea MUCL 33604]|uniref:Mak10 subunit, NatC N(Alpha)-terminal acetyltransferase n=1 Tax=Jaapia argillacea MUCL 33604 TaxID=933084 RepID=A0A067PY88_9AGAM|nr:hypothetical protein JAAARDRAFT_33351 [Jaapia argillacea MUCL 33604]
MDLYSDLPGGDDFRDARSIFEEAARDMEPGGTILMDGFTMQDAMSAIEIGEPRMDSGMVTEDEPTPSFNPLTPLLPEEVCWILDRSLACEMEWHTGNALSQTVFTLVYVHHMQDINPEYMVFGHDEEDPLRPLELITIVLRAGVTGLLKSCDLAWRELSKARVKDGEDFQGEKCEVSLLEGLSISTTVKRLDLALEWIRTSLPVPEYLRDDLACRLSFRKILIQLMALNLSNDRYRLQALVSSARQLLRRIRSRPPADPDLNSPARHAFDRNVTRRLHFFMPLRPIEMPPQERTWQKVEDFIQSWQEICYLSTTTSLSTWQIYGSLLMTRPRPTQNFPYFRSLAQSFFFDGSTFVGRFDIPWISERFFLETLGITFEQFAWLTRRYWVGMGPPPLREAEGLLIKVMMPHIRSFWCNAPRQRRFLSKSLLQWQALYDAFSILAENTAAPDDREVRIIKAVPKAILVWRLSIIREIVFSGFQQELYMADERASAYWYASRVLECQLNVLDDLLGFVSRDPRFGVYPELNFQHQLATALQGMTTAMFIITLKDLKFSCARARLNFNRRHKWAFDPQYHLLQTPPVAQPDFEQFIGECSSVTDEGSNPTPSDLFEQSKSILVHLSSSAASYGWAGRWHEDRLQVVSDLTKACVRLGAICSNTRTLDETVLSWNPSIDPWFPVVAT